MKRCAVLTVALLVMVIAAPLASVLAEEEHVRVYFDYFESFDDGVINLTWVTALPISGEPMTVESGRLVLVPANSSAGTSRYAWFNVFLVLDNASISFDFYPADNGSLMVAVGQHFGDYVGVELNVSHSQVRIVVYNVSAGVETTVAVANYSFDAGLLHHVEIEIANKTVAVYINGSEVVEGNVSAYPYEEAAFLGLTYDAGDGTSVGAYMDNLHIASANYMPRIVEYVTTTYVYHSIETVTETETATTTVTALPVETSYAIIFGALLLLIAALAVVLRRR